VSRRERIAPIALDSIAGLARDFGRRDRLAAMSDLLKLPRNTVGRKFQVSQADYANEMIWSQLPHEAEINS
jgi:hypothetical protein